jgi:uncharacterized delta-60 repeat protein
MSLTGWLVNQLALSSQPASQRKALATRPTFRPQLEALEDRCLPSGGLLDPTFGTGGVVTELPATGANALAVATYPQAGTANDGKIVVGGFDSLPNLNTQFVVLRFNLDGSLDKSFGSGGEVFGPKGTCRAVVIQPDGKILAAGSVVSAKSTDFALARYNTNGSLDSTFGSRGVAITDLSGNSFDMIEAMGLQADGKIVVAGVTEAANSTTTELAVARYNANGSLDTSFGIGGKALDHLATQSWNVQLKMDLVIDSATGGIVVQASDAVGKAMVVRYNSSGKLDATFAGTGHETLTDLDSLSAVAIQPSDNRIVVAGRYYSGGVSGEGLERLNPDGTLDGTFGNGGVVVAPFFPQGSRASVKILSDNQILVGATGNSQFMVSRFSPSGSLDTSFGVGGAALVPNTILPSGSDLEDMALEPDGRIVVAGIPYTGNTQFVVARFLAVGPQIASFTASPDPVTAGSNLTLTASNITDANPGATIVQVAFFYFDNNGNKQVLGYGTQSSPGVWSFTFAVNLTPGTYTLFSQAEDGYGVFGDATAFTLTVV